MKLRDNRKFKGGIYVYFVRLINQLQLLISCQNGQDCGNNYVYNAKKYRG